MIHELRRYKIKIGALGAYLEIFEEIALPLIRRHMTLLSFWTCDIGELNNVIHLWEFADHQARTDNFAALRAEPDYQTKFVPVALPLIESMHSTILNPVGFSERLPLQMRG